MAKLKLRFTNRHLNPAMRKLEEGLVEQSMLLLPYAIDAVVEWLKDRKVKLKKAVKPVDWDSVDWEDLAAIERLIDEILLAPQRAATAVHAEKVYRMGATRALGKVDNSTPVERAFQRADTVRLSEVDRAAIHHAETYTYSEITWADDKFKAAIRRQVLDGIEQGTHPDTIAHEAKLQLSDLSKDYRRIAITETARASAEGGFNALLGAGQELCYIPAAGEGRHWGPGGAGAIVKSCEYCKRLLEGRVFKVADLKGATNFGKKAPSWTAAMPMHPNCRHDNPLRLPSWIQEQVEGQEIPKTGVPVKTRAQLKKEPA